MQRTVQRSVALAVHTRARFAAGLQRLAAGKKVKVGGWEHGAKGWARSPAPASPAVLRLVA